MAESSAQAPRRDLLLLLLLCPLLLAGCLNAHFLDFDDDACLGAPVVTGAAPWSGAFDFGSINGSNFPLPMLTFRIERTLFSSHLGIRNWAAFVRIDNLLLHIAAAVALWLLFRALKFGRGVLLLATGGFLLHPMACESVCWATERKNCLVAAFGFGALAAAVAYRGRFRALLVAALFTLAALSKPSALGLAPVLLCWEGWELYRRRSGGAETSVDSNLGRNGNTWTHAALALYLVLASVVIVGVSLHTHTQMTMSPPGGNLFTAVLTDVEIFRRYMQHLVLPVGLSFAYFVQPVVSLADPRLWLNAFAVFAFIAATLWLSTRRTLSLFCWLWFFAALGPNMNFISTPFLMQDRYVYLSTPAFFGALALALEGLGHRFGTKTEAAKHTPAGRLALLGIWGVLLSYSASAMVRSHVFTSNYTAFGDAVVKEPQSAFASLTYGIALANMADNIETEPALQLNPGAAEELRKEAIFQLQRTSELPDRDRLISPGHYFAALAVVQFKRGRFDEADAAAHKILDEHFSAPVTPEVLVQTHYLLSQTAYKRKDFEAAFNWAKRSLAMAQTFGIKAPEAWIAAGDALAALGRNADAIIAYSKVSDGMAGYENAQRLIKALQPK